MPYTTRVNGNETEIVGYSYTATGTPEPEVGNEWYPVVIDSYTTAEYASLDAYLASEYGKIFLASCGVTALVPIETAILRLAENGINITVVVPQTLFNRLDPENNDYLLVNEQGQLVYLEEGVNQTSFQWDPDVKKYTAVDTFAYGYLTESWGSASLGTWTVGQNKTVTVDGVQYTFTAQGDYYVLTPAAGTYNG